MFLGLLHWLFPLIKSQYCETTSIDSNFFLSTMSCVCFQILSNFYEKWDTYSFVDGLHLYVCMQSWTYDGEPLSFQGRNVTMIQLLGPTTLFIRAFESSPSSDADYNGVFGSSSSITILSFYSTNAYWFASYLK
jgi:hypothetical protein